MSMQSVSTRQSSKGTSANFFLDAEGLPIKFRIQPDFESSLRVFLEDGIALHGGIVITKVPIHGLVVVDPESDTGQELLLDWSWKERPGRRFVPYSFILNCIKEKRLLSIDRHSLIPEQHTLNANNQYDLPQNVKDKLALFLATILPHSTGRRSSYKTYEKLVKNKARYPWVGDYDGRTLRNHYCKNKKYYDKLVSIIVEKRAGREIPNLPVPTIVTDRKQFLVAKTDSFIKPSVIEAVLPRRNDVPEKGQARKKAKFDKPFLIERRKRKFGNDITNEKKEKKPRTIDDMLKVPLPPIVTEPRRPTKPAVSTLPLAGDVDVEIGRHASKNIRYDVWVDDGFKEDGRRLHGKKNTMRISGSRVLDRFSESLAFYEVDFDDLRLAASLDLMGNNNDADVIDEASVLELLELPAAARVADPKLTEKTGKPSQIRSTRSHLGKNEASEPPAILELAESTRFTVGEIKQKLDGFSGNMDKTRDFFVRCRRLVDDLFISSSLAEGEGGDAKRCRSGRPGYTRD